jgi:hypothetical protein
LCYTLGSLSGVVGGLVFSGGLAGLGVCALEDAEDFDGGGEGGPVEESYDIEGFMLGG